MKHTKHYWRAAFIILGAFLGFLIFRGLMVPKSFDKYGFYRGDNIEEQKDKPTVFGKKDACNECHEDIAKIHGSSKHQNVQCQNCHAPLTEHVKDGEMVGAMPIDHTPHLCLRCHQFLPSRPKNFPQITVKEHVGDVEDNLPDDTCSQCHSPHNPLPGPADATTKTEQGGAE